ncbi:DUF4149 domain-containing protein [Nodosilinea sp. E11]|uniref:DUF4149 domain-containing protein n=1 Tax=Nodosilinea sp. E11 TaxID=3037479 RepID=UPI002934704A|nr:DUF4149 domain-containing protein [Nodosilinea sp. E11]WOD40040.1 DUF4149 domain-containing protein [Nodosilinea sp. E11]
MNTLSNPAAARPTRWVGAVLFALMFWFSSSLLMDFVIMPGLFVGGMMSQPDFGSTGYAMFWVFNRLELLCAGVILTGLLVARQSRPQRPVVASGLRSRWAMELGLGLLAVTLVLTYAVAPAMGALGTALDPFATTLEVPAAMNQMHGLYFGLEALKLLGCGALLSLLYGDLSRAEEI